MADGLTTQTSALATIPDATKIATDDATTAGHVQIIKLAISTDGSATVIPADAANGLDVDVTRVQGTVTVGGTVDIGNPEDIGGGGGSTVTLIRTAVTPTVSTSPAYTAKDAVGALMTFASVAVSGHGIQILQVQIVDKAQQQKDYDLIFFDRSITAPTDNGVFAPTDTELGYVIGSVPVSGWMDLSTNSVFDAPVNVTGKLNGTDLYAVLVSRSGTGPTFAATSDIVVTVTTTDLGA